MATIRNKGKRIKELLLEKVPYSKIVLEINCSKATISYHAEKLGLVKWNKRKYNWKDIQVFYDKGGSVSSCMKEFGFARASWTKAVNRGDITPRSLTPLEKLKHRSGVRSRVINYDLLGGYKCSLCGLSEWLNKKLGLRLDHINGVNNDHRLENLRWLCPNCDSQQDTFSGRNTKYQRMKKYSRVF